MENYIEIVKILLYFIIYSCFGWIMESVIKTVVQRKPINSGFLHGPFCPIYGFGAIIMFIFLQRFKDNIILLFISGFFILSLWEYIVGWLLEITFNTKYWDYSNNKFNIKGRVCLLNSLFWGLLGVVFIKFIHPFIVEKIGTINTIYLTICTIALSVAMLVDMIITIIKVKNININLEKLKEISDRIKEKIDELESRKITKEELQEAIQIRRESLQETIDELRHKQIKIKRKLQRQTNRLRNAFPTMKSEGIEKISEFLKEMKENFIK